MAAAGFRLTALAALTAGCTTVTASQASFDGTRWHVTAVNGQATPAAGDYSLQFAQGNVGARFGCNRIGGRYSALGDSLRTFDVHSTLMGCPEPAATFERQGSAVLTAPMRIAWSGETRLTLSNDQGSIALERVP
ncbi:MAG TPA: META domain-containing protein [Sphingomicrobium sp.]|nr:META domain-containing protein [Sphingomicrobium sp.]